MYFPEVVRALKWPLHTVIPTLVRLDTLVNNVHIQSCCAQWSSDKTHVHDWEMIQIMVKVDFLENKAGIQSCCVQYASDKTPYVQYGLWDDELGWIDTMIM
jgi:hypothetical protein